MNLKQNQSGNFLFITTKIINQLLELIIEKQQRMQSCFQLTQLNSIQLQVISNPNTSQYPLRLIQSSKSIPPTSIDFIDFTMNNCDRLFQSSFPNFYDNSLQQTFERTGFFNRKLKQQRKGCICKKTKCLKMYCQCFSQGKNCIVDCSCLDCGNFEGNQQKIGLLKKGLTQKRQKVNKGSQGCNCLKSNCLKKYCQCFNAGRSCTDICKCKNCQNSQHWPVEQTQQSNKDLLYNQK